MLRATRRQTNKELLLLLLSPSSSSFTKHIPRASIYFSRYQRGNLSHTLISFRSPTPSSLELWHSADCLTTQTSPLSPHHISGQNVSPTCLPLLSFPSVFCFNSPIQSFLASLFEPSNKILIHWIVQPTGKCLLSPSPPLLHIFPSMLLSSFESLIACVRFTCHLGHDNHVPNIDTIYEKDCHTMNTNEHF